jgi:hypothetical protein
MVFRILLLNYKLHFVDVSCLKILPLFLSGSLNGTVCDFTLNLCQI